MFPNDHRRISAMTAKLWPISNGYWKGVHKFFHEKVLITSWKAMEWKTATTFQRIGGCVLWTINFYFTDAGWIELEIIHMKESYEILSSQRGKLLCLFGLRIWQFLLTIIFNSSYSSYLYLTLIILALANVFKLFTKFAPYSDNFSTC